VQAEFSAVGAALDWIERSLLGTVATSVAIIAVGSVGLLMLTGRIEVRRAAQVIFGCFVLFGASTIAAGILGMVTGPNPEFREPQVSAPPAPVAPVAVTPPDTYAGAALPPRQ